MDSISSGWNRSSANEMQIFFVSEIPKTAMGKVRRDVLARMVSEKEAMAPKLYKMS